MEIFNTCRRYIFLILDKLSQNLLQSFDIVNISDDVIYFVEFITI